jgi:hypothetical protein
MNLLFKLSFDLFSFSVKYTYDIVQAYLSIL